MIKKIEIEVEVPDKLPDFKKLWKDFNKLHVHAGRIPSWDAQRKQIEKLIKEQLQ